MKGRSSSAVLIYFDYCLDADEKEGRESPAIKYLRYLNVSPNNKKKKFEAYVPQTQPSEVAGGHFNRGILVLATPIKDSY